MDENKPYKQLESIYIRVEGDLLKMVYASIRARHGGNLEDPSEEQVRTYILEFIGLGMYE